MTRDKTILIIGAGIAGLAAGCYAQMNGYRTKILELHDLPGGLCTSWQRKGYIFDGCLHYVFGTQPGRPFYAMWEELGTVQNRQMINHEAMMHIKDFGGTGATDGKTLIVYADPDRLEKHMKELSPADARQIEAFTAGIRKFAGFDMSANMQKPKELMTPTDWAAVGRKMMPFLMPLARWGMVSAREFGQRFKDPFLRRAIPLMFAWEEIPVMVGMSLLAEMHNGNAAFPVGGSLAFAQAIEHRYLELGGEIFYKSQVEKILVKDGRAVGVRLYNDEVYEGDWIISACDGRTTIFDFLGGQFVDRQIKRLYDGHMPIYCQFQVSLGVNRDFSDEPHWVTYLLDEPVLIAGDERTDFNIKHYCFDPGLAPEGKTSLIVMLRTNYAYWQHLYGRQPYDSEQHQVSDIVIDLLEKVYPGLHEQIEVVDEATPLSYERYTGNWQGSSCGWLLTKQTMLKTILGIRNTLPGLQNFYMAGQWLTPGGGVPLAAMSGRNVIWSICHADGRSFTTTIEESN